MGISSIIPPIVPIVTVVVLLIVDNFVYYKSPAWFLGRIGRTIVYGGLIGFAYIRYKSVLSKLQVEADGFMIKTAGKPDDAKHAQTSAKSAASPDGLLVQSVKPTVSVSTWPPTETLGWTPFKSIPFNQARAKGAQHFWSRGSADSFNVRSVGYKQSKAKEPSASPLYECIGVDVVKSSKLVTNISSSAVFQKILNGETSSSGDSIPFPWLRYKDSPWTPALGVPRLLIINMQLPYSSPSLWAPQSADSDPGFSIVSYYALSPTGGGAVSGSGSLPAVKLLKRLIAEGKSTKEETALKVIGLVENMEEVGFPDMVAGYNGKPVLVTKSAKLVAATEQVLEIEYDIRQWSILARKSLHSLRDKLSDAKCQIGMLVEGRTDEELPEQLLGCFRLHFLDINEALNIEI